MAVTVRVPTQLRTLSGGKSEVPVEGATVAEVLKSLEAAHPGFSDRLFDDAGKLRRFVNVFVADEAMQAAAIERHIRPEAVSLALFALDVPFALATGAVARFRGRRWWPWALFGLFAGPIAFLAVLIVAVSDRRTGRLRCAD